MESISSLGSRRKRHWVALFSPCLGFSSSLCISHPREPGAVLTSLPTWLMKGLKNLLHIALARRIRRFTVSYARLIIYTLCTLFLSMVIMFYNFASFKQIWTTKYTNLVQVITDCDREAKKSAGWKQTIRRVLRRLNYHWIYKVGWGGGGGGGGGVWVWLCENKSATGQFWETNFDPASCAT